MSVSVIEVKTPKIPNTTDLYGVNADTFQLPKGVILQRLNIPMLNAKNVSISICKNMPIASMYPVRKCEAAQEFSWSRLWCNTSKLLPETPQNTLLQLELDTKGLTSSIPDVDIPEEARTKFQ